jgi:hypothetical protein
MLGKVLSQQEAIARDGQLGEALVRMFAVRRTILRVHLHLIKPSLAMAAASHFM